MKCPICKKSDEVVTRPDGPYCLDCGRAVVGPSDETACSAYVVRGYALVPHEVEIWVEAESPRQAMQKAKKIFERGPNRGQWIVSNSEDIGAAYDFEPNEAKPPISRQNKS